MNNGVATIENMTVVAQASQAPGRIESASASAAALAKASVEARYLVAINRPRDMNMVRLKVLDTCKRPAFAVLARYAKPVAGSHIVGPSVRFAEEAARCLGNILAESAIVHEDGERRIVRVTVTDLENNLTYPQDVIVEKHVERKYLRKGQAAIKQRTNSLGETVYIVEATEDELLQKQNSLISKAYRTSVLKLLPRDILDEAMEAVEATLNAADKSDPEAAKKKLLDSFYAKGVTPESLKQYLGHPIEQCTPKQIDDLRLAYAALKEGESTWAEIMEAKHPGKEKEAGKHPTKSRGEQMSSLVEEGAK